MSTEKEKCLAFHQFLQNHGIGGFSPSIPEDVGKHLNGVPFEEDLVPIPPMETFPLPTVEKPQKVDPSDMRAMFTQAQIEASLFEQPEEDENDDKKPDEKIQTFDIPLQYVSAGHFVRFKKELNTSLYLEGKGMGIDQEIHCCKELSCCNPCVPSFDYCLNHLAQDPKFKEQKFLTICSVEGCNNICPAGVGICAKHKNKR